MKTGNIQEPPVFSPLLDLLKGHVHVESESRLVPGWKWDALPERQNLCLVFFIWMLIQMQLCLFVAWGEKLIPSSLHSVSVNLDAASCLCWNINLNLHIGSCNDLMPTHLSPPGMVSMINCLFRQIFPKNTVHLLNNELIIINGIFGTSQKFGHSC